MSRFWNPHKQLGLRTAAAASVVVSSIACGASASTARPTYSVVHVKHVFRTVGLPLASPITLGEAIAFSTAPSHRRGYDVYVLVYKKIIDARVFQQRETKVYGYSGRSLIRGRNVIVAVAPQGTRMGVKARLRPIPPAVAKAVRILAGGN